VMENSQLRLDPLNIGAGGGAIRSINSPPADSDMYMKSRSPGSPHPPPQPSGDRDREVFQCLQVPASVVAKH